MKINYIIGISLISLIFGSSEPQTGWFFDQTINQSFYLLEDITIDDLAVQGEGTGSTDGNFGSCSIPGEAPNSSPSNCVGAGGTWENGAPTGACSYFSDDNKD